MCFLCNFTDPDSGQIAFQQHQQDQLSCFIANGSKCISAFLKGSHHILLLLGAWRLVLLSLKFMNHYNEQEHAFQHR